MNEVLNINCDAAVIFTNKLEKMHRSALPNAVRTALNSAAFDVKKNTMPDSSKKAFENRSANFFKANSRVDMATGFNMKSMQATVGFKEMGLKGSNNFAVKDLEQQEHGGGIKKKSFIPLATARTGGSKSKNVRPINRLSAINKIVDTKNAQGKSPGQKFIKSVAFAGVGGTVLSEYKDKTILWRVNSLKRGKDGSLKLTALYTFKTKRDVHVKGLHFMQRASLKSAFKIERFFKEAAIKAIDKIR